MRFAGVLTVPMVLMLLAVLTWLACVAALRNGLPRSRTYLRNSKLYIKMSSIMKFKPHLMYDCTGRGTHVSRVESSTPGDRRV